MNFVPPKGNVKIKYKNTSLEQIKNIQMDLRKQYPKYCVDNIINHWFIRRLCIHGDMKHLVAFLSTQEARVAPGCASSNSYASLVFSKLSSCFISP